MTTPQRRRPAEPAGVARDDRLLDALGRGEPAGCGDIAGHLLAAWREQLPGDGTVGACPAGSVLWSTVGSQSGPRPADRAGLRRRRQAALAGATLGLLVVVGGTGAAASRAGPDSPLWPVTELFFAHRAEARLAQWHAEQAIRDARTALSRGRYADVHRNLDRATVLLPEMHPSAQARLRAEIAAIRHVLPPTQTALTPPAEIPVPAKPTPPATTDRPAGKHPVGSADPVGSAGGERNGGHAVTPPPRGGRQ